MSSTSRSNQGEFSLRAQSTVPSQEPIRQKRKHRQSPNVFESGVCEKDGVPNKLGENGLNNQWIITDGFKANGKFSSVQFSRSVVSDSVRPYRRQPTRLPRPWGSPGKNTGVGCRFLLQCMKVKSQVAQSCLTLCDPMNRSSQASLSITNSQSSPRLTPSSQ